jgi:hypothetical protein
MVTAAVTFAFAAREAAKRQQKFHHARRMEPAAAAQLRTGCCPGAVLAFA